MGTISVQTSGSFRHVGISDASFSAMEHGHAEAVEEAIRFLQEALPSAVDFDLKLAREGELPSSGFGPTIKARLE